MISLKAKIRGKSAESINSLRKKGIIPAVLYGSETKNLSLGVDEKEFKRVYQEAGKSSLISLDIEKDSKSEEEKSSSKKVQVLIHDTSRDPLTEKFLHIDFYHPSSTKEVQAEIPLVFEGQALAVKDLGGTLVREIQSIEVKGLAQNLPREIKVNIGVLKTFEDRILIKDLKISSDITILREPDEVVANVVPPAEEEEAPTEEAEKPEEVETEEEGKDEEKKGEKK